MGNRPGREPEVGVSEFRLSGGVRGCQNGGGKLADGFLGLAAAVPGNGLESVAELDPG